MTESNISGSIYWDTSFIDTDGTKVNQTTTVTYVSDSTHANDTLFFDVVVERNGSTVGSVRLPVTTNGGQAIVKSIDGLITATIGARFNVTSKAGFDIPTPDSAN